MESNIPMFLILLHHVGRFLVSTRKGIGQYVFLSGKKKNVASCVFDDQSCCGTIITQSSLIISLRAHDTL